MPKLPLQDIVHDGITNAAKIIDHGHHEIHGGSHFMICGEAVLSAESVDFQLTTPNTTKWTHMTFGYSITDEMLFEIYESATVSADGTGLTAYNNNRNSTKTTGLTLLQTDGSVAVAGSKIYAQRTGYNNTPSRFEGGASTRDREIILKQGTTYRFLFTSAGANNFSYCGEWYDHTNI